MENFSKMVDISSGGDDSPFLVKLSSLQLNKFIKPVSSSAFACLKNRIVDPIISEQEDAQEAKKITFTQSRRYRLSCCAITLLENIPDSELFVSVDHEGDIYFWDFSGSSDTTLIDCNNNKTVLSLAINARKQLMVNCAFPKITFTLHDTDQEKPTQKMLPQFDSVTVHPTQQYFLCKKGLSGTFVTWDGEVVLKEGVPKLFWRGDATWDKDDHTLITGQVPGSNNLNLNVYTLVIDYPKGTLDYFSHDASIENDTGVYPLKIVTGKDGWVAFTSSGERVGIVNRHRSKKCDVLSGHHEVTALAFHPTKPYLAVADSSKSMRLWDVEKKTTLAVLETQKKLLSLLWHPQENTLVVGADDEHEPLARYGVDGL
jgi:WD40 repeat protein